MIYITYNEHIYVLNSKSENEQKFDSENFNPKTYDFSEGDYRMSINYVRNINFFLLKIN